MPVFLQELNLWSWTGPQECFYCSTHLFNSHGRHVSSAGGAKAGQKKGICVGLLLVQSCFIFTEKKRTRFPLFPKYKPRTWRLLWGAGCCVGRWVKKMLPPSHHTQHCLACRSRVFSCCEIAQGFVHPWNLSSSQGFDLESKLSDLLWPKPGLVFISRILRAIVLWWNFFSFLLFIWGVCPFLECAVSQGSKEH